MRHFFPQEGRVAARVWKTRIFFPKQSGLFGEEFDKNINPHCSAPTIFLFLIFEPLIPGSVLLAPQLQEFNGAKRRGSKH